MLASIIELTFVMIFIRNSNKGTKNKILRYQKNDIQLPTSRHIDV